MVDERFVANMIGMIDVEYRLNESVEDIKSRIRLWAAELGGYPEKIVTVAFRNVIRSSVFAPKLADIVTEIERIENLSEKSAEDVWREISGLFDAVSWNKAGYRYNATEENGKTQGENCYFRNKKLYESLSDEAKRYVTSLSELEELSQLPQDSLRYEKARFMKRYPELQSNARLIQRLPSEVKEMIGQAAWNTYLPSGRKGENRK